MTEELISIKNAAISFILEAESPKELEEIKLQFLGKSGTLTTALKGLAKLPEEKKPEVGQLANEVKHAIEDAIAQKAESLKEKKTVELKQKIDITEPGVKPTLGHLHPITQAIDEITSIFEKIGFTRVRYPEIEWDWYAFTSLNFPDNHPARDDWETFFIKQDADTQKGPVVLTPHTSSGQVREMEKGKLPIKMLNIAKCYRRQSDVSHTQMFHQFEGLVVGNDIAITHLKGTLDYFVKSYFGEKRISRIRPYHFQFTEPSFEVDVSCGVCEGTGYVIPGSTRNPKKDPSARSERHTIENTKKEVCRLCKQGWLEMGGAGMVHPNVLKAGGIDPKKHTGFAFGWGVERVLMMKEGIEIDDLRLLYSNNLEFLNQF